MPRTREAGAMQGHNHGKCRIGASSVAGTAHRSAAKDHKWYLLLVVRLPVMRMYVCEMGGIGLSLGGPSPDAFFLTGIPFLTFPPLQNRLGKKWISGPMWLGIRGWKPAQQGALLPELLSLPWVLVWGCGHRWPEPSCLVLELCCHCVTAVNDLPAVVGADPLQPPRCL